MKRECFVKPYLRQCQAPYSLVLHMECEGIGAYLSEKNFQGLSLEKLEIPDCSFARGAISFSMISVCDQKLLELHIHQSRKVRMVARMFCLHMGHCVSLVEHAKQHARCPHGMNAMSAFESMHTLHSVSLFLSSESLLVPGPIRAPTFACTPTRPDGFRGVPWEDVRVRGPRVTELVGAPSPVAVSGATDQVDALGGPRGREELTETP